MTARRSTILSPCMMYRYTLWREWIGGEGYAMFMGVNPSTADEIESDNTITREINYAKSWGCNAQRAGKVELIRLRSTDPDEMKAASEPVGPDNDKLLLAMANDARVIVAAWGKHGVHRRPPTKCRRGGRDRLSLHRLCTRAM